QLLLRGSGIRAVHTGYGRSAGILRPLRPFHDGLFDLYTPNPSADRVMVGAITRAGVPTTPGPRRR
ncbi:MAG TPA: hypothetical protein PK274_08880, partial [Candidatus Fermentibacter daniensis]|nr:hypothetical protein [Candidatus Fermentibacter daniensis]